MNQKVNQVIQLFKEQLGILLGISLGVFLFLLVFQPFPVERFEYENRLLFMAGLGIIVFLFLMLVRVALPVVLPKLYRVNNEFPLSAYLSGFSVFVVNAIAFAFYIRYVGQVDITFYIMLKIVLICIIPPAILRVYDVTRELKTKNAILTSEQISMIRSGDNTNEFSKASVEFHSENRSENLNIRIADIAFIKSADNYVEIAYREGNDFKKKLIRNTLKNIENQIKPYIEFIRCHRICIINQRFIEKLHNNYGKHWVTVKGFAEEIPVSRQYLLKLKEGF